MTNQVVKSVSQYDECFISVDVETSGPIPGAYSLLSIGAYVISKITVREGDKLPATDFYCTLRPLSTAGSDPEAMKVAGLSLVDLTKTGKEPAEAMKLLAVWVESVCGDMTPVFVGFNAAFDWSFINYYFHFFLGKNPFGFSAVDIKSLYMGMAGGTWADTKLSRVTESLGIENSELSHQALEDAKIQAEVFRAINSRVSRSS